MSSSGFNYYDALVSRLLPVPARFSLSEGILLLKDGVSVQLKGCDRAEAVRKAFSKFWKVSASVRDGGASSVAGDAYKILVTGDGICVEAATASALRYALNTLRQLAETERGKPGTAGYLLPRCEIDDAPLCAFRGIHLCIFPETSLSRIEEMVRLAGYLKFNYVVIEPWGVFPFKSHPEFGWSDKMFTREELSRLLEIAQEAGVTLIPQLNIFGHASFSRVGSGKHAVLDRHPEFEPIYEPGGWSYCLSNPETRKILTDLAVEMHDAFGRPPFFHIGCDEAYDFQTCAECAGAAPERLMLDHINHFHELFASRRTRLIMWHDMLLDRADRRWDHCIVCGDARTADLYGKIPKDIIIADWQYDQAPSNNAEHEWPTSNFFKDAGFDVLMCPWMDRLGIRQIGGQVVRRRLFGILETTWNTAYAAHYVTMFALGSVAAWGGDCSTYPSGLFPPNNNRVNISLAKCLRHVHADMGVGDYIATGHSDFQVCEHSWF